MPVDNRWGTERAEAFSDGVIAIAITLLVLDIGIPAADFGDLLHGIWRQWPAYLGFVTSFMTIGGIWLAHHAVFRRLRLLNGRVMALNLLLLMVVSFLPFPTRLVAEAIRETQAERVAVVFYGLTLLAISVVFAALWRAALADRALLREEVDDEQIAAVTRATTPNVGFYVITTALGLLAPKVAAFGYLVIAVRAVLSARGDTTAPSSR
ncbi:MAG TPA: TMEM175 family protein [Solirubrobacteraceae bacterium]|nr:TMEM175 family protein [Solirubrobacteraceae bacterium]